MKKICKECGKLKEHTCHNLCRSCYDKTECVMIHGFGRKTTIKVYANGFTKELKPLLPQMKKRILQDCINNPRKYLE